MPLQSWNVPPARTQTLPDLAKGLDDLLTPPRSAGGSSSGLTNVMRQMMMLQRMQYYQQQQRERALGATKEEREKNKARLQLDLAAQQAVSDPEYVRRYNDLWNYSSVKRLDELNRLRKEYIAPLARQYQVEPSALQDALTGKAKAEFDAYRKNIEGQTSIFTGAWENIKAAGRRLRDLPLELPGVATDEERLEAARRREQEAAADRAANPALQDIYQRQQEGEGLLSRPGLVGALAGGAVEMAPYAVAAVPFVGPAIAAGLGAVQSGQAFADTTVLAQPDQQRQLEAMQGPERYAAMGIGGALGALSFRAGAIAGRGLRSIQRATGTGELGRAVRAAGTDAAAREAAAQRVLNQQAVTASGRGALSRAAGGAVEEGLTFAGMGAGQQVSTNALVNSAAGTDIPVTSGALEAAIMGAVPGAAMGGIRGVLHRTVRPYTRNDGSPREKTAEQYAQEIAEVRRADENADLSGIVNRIKADNYSTEQLSRILDTAGIVGTARNDAMAVWSGSRRTTRTAERPSELALSTAQRRFIEEAGKSRNADPDNIIEVLKGEGLAEREILGDLHDFLNSKAVKGVKNAAGLRRWLDSRIQELANAEDYAGLDALRASLRAKGEGATPQSRLSAVEDAVTASSNPERILHRLEAIDDTIKRYAPPKERESLLSMAKAIRDLERNKSPERAKEINDLIESARKEQRAATDALIKELSDERAARLRPTGQEGATGTAGGTAQAGGGVAPDTAGVGAARPAGSDVAPATPNGTTAGRGSSRTTPQNLGADEAAAGTATGEGAGQPAGEQRPAPEPNAGGQEAAPSAGEPDVAPVGGVGGGITATGAGGDQSTPAARVAAASRVSPGNVRDALVTSAKWLKADADSLMYALAKEAAGSKRLTNKERALLDQYNTEFGGDNPFTGIIRSMLNDPMMTAESRNVNSEGFRRWLGGYLDASLVDAANNTGIRPWC